MATRPMECGSCGKDHPSAEECEKTPPNRLTYSAGLQDDEDSATLDCGCVLTTDGGEMQTGACDIALFTCPMHDHAADLLAEARDILNWFEATKDENNLARIHSCGLDRLREIVKEMS